MNGLWTTVLEMFSLGSANQFSVRYAFANIKQDASHAVRYAKHAMQINRPEYYETAKPVESPHCANTPFIWLLFALQYLTRKVDYKPLTWVSRMHKKNSFERVQP